MLSLNIAQIIVAVINDQQDRNGVAGTVELRPGSLHSCSRLERMARGLFAHFGIHLQMPRHGALPMPGRCCACPM